MFSAGAFIGDETTDDIVLRDAARGVYKRLVLRDDKLVGVVCFGDATRCRLVFSDAKDEEHIGDLRETMIFGPIATRRRDPNEALACLPDTAEICGCNGVKKGTIMFRHQGVWPQIRR